MLRPPCLPGLLGIALALSVSPNPLDAQHWIAFRAGMGVSEPVGGTSSQGFGDFLDTSVGAEFTIVVQPTALGRFRTGFGFSWITYPTSEEVRFADGSMLPDTLRTWNLVGGHVLLGYSFPDVRGLRPHLEGRLLQRRFRSERARRHAVDSDDPLKERNFYQSAGYGAEAIAGAEVPLGGKAFLEISLRWADFGPESADLSEFALPNIDGGTSFGVYLALLWYP